jgi:hypothetical protein
MPVPIANIKLGGHKTHPYERFSYQNELHHRSRPHPSHCEQSAAISFSS